MSKVKEYLPYILILLLTLLLCSPTILFICEVLFEEKPYSEFNAALTNELSRFGIFVPDTAEFVVGKRVNSLRDPCLTVTFDICADDADDLHQVFHEQLWSWDDIETAWKSQVGEDTDIRWVDNVYLDDPEAVISEYNELTITKTSVDTYRVHFSGVY